MYVTISPSPHMLELYARTVFADIRSYREPLKESIDEVVTPRIKLNFIGETAAGEYNWQRLARRTEYERDRLGFGKQHPKLRRTDKLFRAATRRRAIWTFKTQTVPPEAFIDPRKLQMRVPYALYHQEGVEFRMPAREYMVINESDAQKIEEIFADYLVKREVVAALGIRWATARVAGIR